MHHTSSFPLVCFIRRYLAHRGGQDASPFEASADFLMHRGVSAKASSLGGGDGRIPPCQQAGHGWPPVPPPPLQVTKRIVPIPPPPPSVPSPPSQPLPPPPPPPVRRPPTPPPRPSRHQSVHLAGCDEGAVLRGVGLAVAGGHPARAEAPVFFPVAQTLVEPATRRPIDPTLTQFVSGAFTTTSGFTKTCRNGRQGSFVQ